MLCAVGFLGAGHFQKSQDIAQHHVGVNVFVTAFFSLLIVWGMFASLLTFIRGRQMITFFIVEITAVLFVRFRPAVSAIIIMSSYFGFYMGLNLWVKPGMINRYNFMMMALISSAGAVVNYALTVNYIRQKNKANQLNESLEVIANHDSMTRPQNRYALNQTIPDYLGMDICIAMLDVNNFKEVNDTYGHRTGDDVLQALAQIILKCFGKEDTYRYGGDEFLIVYRSDDIDGFRKKLEAMNEEFGRVLIEGANAVFSCSCGCAAARPGDQEEFFDMIMQADKKLYEAKSAKKR